MIRYECFNRRNRVKIEYEGSAFCLSMFVIRSDHRIFDGDVIFYKGSNFKVFNSPCLTYIHRNHQEKMEYEGVLHVDLIS